MKDIFSDLYDKVLSFFTSTQPETKSVAKSRLKTVLMQDRVGFSERAMQMLKDDMIETISRYLEINVESFNLSIDATEDATVLNFSIPVLRPKTDEEIDEAIALLHQAKIDKTEEIVDELKELVKEKAQELAQNMAENQEEKEEAQEETKEDVQDSQEAQEEAQEVELEPESAEKEAPKQVKKSKK
ncbi:cell division topological specificity factor MinE [bacterium]|nr:cell division topological specificity factor MinE [bacterium]